MQNTKLSLQYILLMLIIIYKTNEQRSRLGNLRSVYIPRKFTNFFSFPIKRGKYIQIFTNLFIQ